MALLSLLKLLNSHSRQNNLLFAGDVLNTSYRARKQTLIPLGIPLHAECKKKTQKKPKKKPLPPNLSRADEQKHILLMLTQPCPPLRGSCSADCQWLLLFRYVSIPTKTRPSRGTSGSGNMVSSLILSALFLLEPSC